MELKVVCDCGQKYKFDVEPAGGQMPVKVNCPACGVDGTAAANSILSRMFPQPGCSIRQLPPRLLLSARCVSIGLRPHRPRLARRPHQFHPRRARLRR